MNEAIDKKKEVSAKETGLVRVSQLQEKPQKRILIGLLGVEMAIHYFLGISER